MPFRYIIAILSAVTTLLSFGTSFSRVFDSHSMQADYILVEKAERRLTIFVNDAVVKSYKIAIGKSPEGHKVKEGDLKTPEGIYFIDDRNMDSRFHLALHISYPNEIDLFFAEKLGVSPGGNIMIHGIGDEYAWMGKYHSVDDWTDGCIAVTNDEIEEIWNLVPDGTKIEIRP